MKTRLEKWVWESGPKIDSATGVTNLETQELFPRT